jgi:hypothetical protein
VKLQQSQGTKFPQSTAALIVRCCLKVLKKQKIFATDFINTNFISVWYNKGMKTQRRKAHAAFGDRG